MRDALIIVTLTEVPQADLVEIVQPDRTGDGIDQDGIGHGDGDDVGEVEVEEIGVAEDRLVGDVGNHDQHQEDPGY